MTPRPSILDRSSTAIQWVFAYASLVQDLADGATAAELVGYRRTWGVAADNTETVPGYKVYIDRSDGSRPELFVSFLDLERQDGSVVHGAIRPVDADALADLDRRERNYDRVDVTAEVSEAPGTVWTYLGSKDGRARLREGVVRGSAVIARDYLDQVQRGLAALPHPDPLPGGLPVRDLQRVGVPA